MDASWIALVLYVAAGLVVAVYFVQVLIPNLRQGPGNMVELREPTAWDEANKGR